jgi:uncharacterized protein YggE
MKHILVYAAMAGAALMPAAPQPVAALLGASPVAAQQTAEQPRTLTITATATVDRAPDQAVILLAVESEGATARAAATANASRMDRVVAALRGVQIPATSIRTISYELQPQYAQSPNKEPRIASYRAMNQVQVTLDAIDRVGPAIDAALGGGANRVSQLSFGVKDAASARLEALQAAVAKAHAEADVIARAAGQSLGVPLSINTDSYNPPPRPMPMYRMSAEVAAAPTPVEGGTMQVGATVNIVYKLINP